MLLLKFSWKLHYVYTRFHFWLYLKRSSIKCPNATNIENCTTDEPKLYFWVYVRKCNKMYLCTISYENCIIDVSKHHLSIYLRRGCKNTPVPPVLKIELRILEITIFGYVREKVAKSILKPPWWKFHYVCPNTPFSSVCAKK